jgi:radical SAM protein with 4Fe4S-binding SPASM domain
LIKEISYKNFSLAAHLGNLNLSRPNTCQLELTYSCGLRCTHCYVSSYNRPELVAGELKTAAVKKIMAELINIGVLWLCFTGGDPLVRPDFCELYAYAREQGFVVTVFTNGYSLRREHIELFKRQPPFSIEITLNAVEEALYENISGVRGSFKKVMAVIAALRRNKLPLRIKTAVTKDNVHHLPALKKYLRERGLKFEPDYFLHAGLGLNHRPLEFRLPAKYFNRHNKLKNKGEGVRNALFPCVAPGGDGFQIDPYGQISSCRLIRWSDFNVLDNGVAPALKNMVGYFRGLDFTTDSKCKTCATRAECGWCPGKALVETGSMEKPIDYCCEMVKADGN